MIEEIGIVTQADGETARVAVQKRGTCDGCAARGVCETKEEGMEIEAYNPVMARKGQTVKVSIKAQTYLKGTIFVYGFPLLAFIAGIILGKNLSEKYFPAADSDLVAIISGFVLLVMSMFVVRTWSKKVESKREYKPVIEEIIQQEHKTDIS
jgi:sigma-E factor negative regulatory protein RseC